MRRNLWLTVVFFPLLTSALFFVQLFTGTISLVALSIIIILQFLLVILYAFYQRQISEENDVQAHFLEKILDNVEAIIYAKDLQGRFLFLNAAFEKRLNIKRQSAIGKTCYEFMSHEFAKQYEKNDNHAIAEKKSFIFEETAPQPDGVHTYLSLKLPFLDDSGHPTMLLGVSTDITERKKIERLLQEKDEDLVNLNKQLEAFSYSVSHDLRAPLRAINGFSQILLEEQEDKLSADAKNALERIMANVARMDVLIESLLQLSRVTRVEVKFVEVNLSEEAEAILTELKRNEPERDVVWTVAKNINVQGDRSLLRIMLTNLINNAWKFTRDTAKAHIVFDSMPSADPNEIIIFVGDNGAGFDMQFKDKLFKVFQRLHSQEEFPGVGVGLAAAYRIATAHAGKIWAEAQPGEGATFYITFPHNR